MNGMVCLNGEILPGSEARISIFDRGFLYGDGLFETMRVYDGKAHLLRRHLERLERGAGVLGISLPDTELLRDWIRRTIAADGATDAALRLTVTRGVGGTVQDPSAAGTPTVMILLRPLLQSRPLNTTNNDKREAASSLVTLRSVHAARGFASSVKTLNYLPAIRAGFELRETGAREGIMTTEEGIVAGVSLGNLFCVRDGVLHTPPLDLGILPGITRGRVIELAAVAGIECRESMFDVDALRSAEEVFHTNSVRELMPVSHIDGMPVGNGSSGEVTSNLLALYRAEAPDEEL